MAKITKAEFQNLKKKFLMTEGEYVEIEDGFEVFVAPFTAKSAVALMTTQKDDKDKSQNGDLFDIIRVTTYDSENVLLFDSKEEVEQLTPKAFGKLSEVVIRLNKILNADEAIEVSEKNLEEVDS